MLTDRFPGRKGRPAEIDRTGGVVLDPLTEVGIGVFMPVVIGSRQLVVNVLCDCKGRDHEQQKNQPKG